MNYVGDFAADETVYLNFASYDSNGASVTLTGLATSDIEVYKNGSTTQRSSDAGYTVSTDFDTITGIHAISIDTSNNTDAGFFAAGNDYVVIVSSVTIDSQTVSFVAGSFSIENRFMRGTDSAALATDLATVDTNVDAILVDTGTTIPAQITGLNNLSAAQVNAEVDTAISDAALATAANLATVDTNVDAILVDTGTTIPAQITALNDLSAADVNAEVDTALADYDGPTKAELDAGLAALNDPTAAAIADAVLDEATSGHTTPGTVGAAIVDILADTNELQADDVPGLIAALNNVSIGDILQTQLTESYAADGVAPTLTQAIMLVQQILTELNISGLTGTIKKLDGSTTAATLTYDSATQPTSVTRSG